MNRTRNAQLSTEDGRMEAMGDILTLASYLHADLTDISSVMRTSEKHGHIAAARVFMARAIAEIRAARSGR